MDQRFHESRERFGLGTNVGSASRMTGVKSRLGVEVKRLGPITHVRISGILDETFALPDVDSLTGSVILDLGRVSRLSSSGVRKWSAFASQLPPKAQALYVINAPPVFVDQLNLVEGFAGTAQVLSVLAPYSCPKCREDRLRPVSLVLDSEMVLQGELSICRCVVCASELEFSDTAEEFFSYMRARGPLELDPVVVRYIRAINPHGVGTDQLEHPLTKLIEGDITYFALRGRMGREMNVRRLSADAEGQVLFDVANIVSLDSHGCRKLTDVLSLVAESATPILWRVPVPVLKALAGAGVADWAPIASLWLPADCRACGARSYERIDPENYIKQLEKPELLERDCATCRGRARLVTVGEDIVLFIRVVSTYPALPEFEALEQKAFATQLATGGAPSVVLSGKTPAPLSQPTPAPSFATPPPQAEPPPPSGPFAGDGRIELLRRIGQGGMAEVFYARQRGVKGFEKYLAVKRVLPQYVGNAEFVEMLFCEARANARLSHPNIVQTFDVGELNGTPYLTMEYIRGPDLKRVLKLLRRKKIALPIEHGLRIVAEIAKGLHYAHGFVDPDGKPHPMVHRDISPHNVLISLDGAIKLGDFGIAKVEGEGEKTKHGVLKGKVSYLSPEAIRSEPLDARTDVFSLGVLMYEVLVGKPPFRLTSEAAVLSAICSTEPSRPSDVNASVPYDVSAIVMRALQKDRTKRTQSAAHLQVEVEEAMGRHRLHSSPGEVAHFIRKHLGEELAEYTGLAAEAAEAPPSPPAPVEGSRSESLPIEIIESSGGGGSRKQPVVVAALPLPPMDPEKTSPATPGPIARAHVSTPRIAVSAAVAAPTLVAASAPVSPAQALSPPDDLAQSPHRPLHREVAAPVAAQPPPPVPAGTNVTAVSPLAHLPGTVALPSSPSRSEWDGPTPRTSSPSGNLYFEDSGIHARRGGAPMPTTSSSWAAIIGLALVLSVVAVGGAAAYFGLDFSKSSKPAPVQIGQQERLFVDGVLTDPATLRPGARAGLLAVAQAGKLVRYGTPSGEQTVDTRSLKPVGNDLDLSERVTVEGRASAAGCSLAVGDEAPVPVPGSLTVPAGVEVWAKVTCPGRAEWKTVLLGLPGQRIELNAP